MDSETAKERIADAIDALIPDCANRSSWLRTEALAMNMPFKSLEKYHAAAHECLAGAYLKMCAQWPDFHARVTGQESDTGDPLTRIDAAVAELRSAAPVRKIS